MKATYLISAIAGATLMSTAAFAGTGAYDNMCAMGLAMGKQVKTDCSISGEIGGQTYCFGTEEAKVSFMKDADGNLAKASKYYKSL
jgi:YHS domain-containing protein